MSRPKRDSIHRLQSPTLLEFELTPLQTRPPRLDSLLLKFNKFYFQFFIDHPPRSLIEYCLKPDIFLILLQNFTENATYEKNEKTFFENDDRVFDDEPNSALFSFMLQFFTFWIAYYLKIFRNGKALGRTVSSQKQEVMASLGTSHFVNIDVIM